MPNFLRYNVYDGHRIAGVAHSKSVASTTFVVPHCSTKFTYDVATAAAKMFLVAYREGALTDVAPFHFGIQQSTTTNLHMLRSSEQEFLVIKP